MSNVRPRGGAVASDGGRATRDAPQQQTPVDVVAGNAAAAPLLAAKDDAAMLRELAHLTTQPAPFVARATSQSVASTGATAITTTTTTDAAAAQPTITLEEEQQVLDAVLDAVTVAVESEDEDDAANDSGQLDITDEAGRTAEQKVEQILAHAVAVAAANSAARKADPSHSGSGSSHACREATVLRFHEHTSLHRSLHRVRTVLGVATCLAMAPPTLAHGRAATRRQPTPQAGDTREATTVAVAQGSTRRGERAAAQRQRREAGEVQVAVGLSQGAVALYGPHWQLYGLCGASASDTHAARGAVLALSIAVGGRVVASGHERDGVCVLWSVSSLSALRVITDVFAGPLLQLRHVAPHEHRLVGLDRTGRLRLLHCTAVLGAVIVRTAVTRLAGPREEGAPGAAAALITGFDLMPHPSARYVMNAEDAYLQAYRRDAAHGTRSPPADGAEEQSHAAWPAATAAAASLYWSDSPVLVQPNRHLLATISAEGVGLHVIDSGGLQTHVTTIARHLCRPHAAETTARDGDGGSAQASHGAAMTTEASVCFVVSEPQDDHTARVLLCAVWGTQLELLRVGFSDRRGEAEGLTRTAVLMTESPLRGLAVVGGGDSRGGNLLLAIDDADTIRLLAVTAETAVVVESYALGPLDLVHYAGTGHASAATGGAPQARSSLCSYRGAMASNGLYVLLLGAGRVMSCTVVPWYAQLEALLLRHRYTHAMELAHSFVADAALAVVGLSADRASRRRALLPYLRAIVVGYLSDALLAAASTTDEAHGDGNALQEAVSRVLSFCSAVDVMDVFWGPAMELLREAAVAEVALRAVEPFVLRDVVTAMPASCLPAFFDAIVHDGEEEDEEGSKERQGTSEVEGEAHTQRGVARAERALMHLDADLDSLLRFAATHELIRLTVTLLSVRQGQYVAALSAALDFAETHAQAAAPSVALDYLRCTLHDTTLLPGLDVPATLRVKAKRSVWAHLLQPPAVAAAADGGAAVGAAQRSALPLLRLLRLYDEDTAVIDLLVESLCEEEREDEEGRECYSVWAARPQARRTCAGRLLSLLTDDTVSERMLHASSAAASGAMGGQGSARQFRPWELAKRAWPPYAMVHVLMRGLVTLVGRNLLPPLTGEAAAELVEVVVRDYLYVFHEADSVAARRELQAQLVRFMRATCVVQPSAGNRDGHGESGAAEAQASLRVGVAVWRRYEEDFCTQRMARCLAVLYCLARDYGRAIDCYLDPAYNLPEPDLAADVFALLHEETSELVARNAADELAQLRRAIVQRVEALVQIDAAALAHFVRAFLASHQAELMGALRGSSRALLRYLDELLAHGDAQLTSEMAVQNSYVGLLCEHAPERVYRYLRAEHDHITYDVQRALDVVRSHGVTDAAIFLLEKTFRTEEAMQLLQSSLLERLHAVRSLVAQRVAAEGDAAQIDPSAEAASRTEADVVASAAWQALQALLQVGIELCAKHTEAATAAGTHRHARAVPAGDSTVYWLRLLELVTTPRRLLCVRQRANDALREQSSDGDLRSDGVSDDELACSAQWLAGRPPRTGVHVTDTRTLSAPPAAASLPPTPHGLTRRGRCFVAVMIALYTRCTMRVLQSMTRAVDLAAVVAAVLRAGAPTETLGPFKPLLVDIMSSLRHDRTVSQLAQRCTEADCLRLASTLYTRVNRGIVVRTTDCALCRGALRDEPSDRGGTGGSTAAAGAGRGTVCLFACGHGYHDACLAAVTAGQQQQRCCVVCGTVRGLGASREGGGGGGDASGSGAEVTTRLLTPTPARSAKGDVQPRPTRREATATTTLRRLRQTCARVDLMGEYADVLRSFMTDDGSAARSTAEAGAERGAKAAGELVRGRVSRRTALPRGPAPPLESVALGALEGKQLDLSDGSALNAIEGLTDADLLDLFGDA